MFRRLKVVYCASILCACILFSYPVISSAELTHTEPIYPIASATNVLKKDAITVDISNDWLGYIMIRQEVRPGEFITTLTHMDSVYQYDQKSDGEYATYPLSEGDGRYAIEVYELSVPNTNRYHRIFSNSIDVVMPDPYAVFLIPNDYVWFTRDSAIIQKSEELCEGLTDAYDMVDAIYQYVTDNILYDYIKAATVSPHYIPNADETLATGRGICFDFAVLFAGMLREQGIPAKLIIGKHMSTNPPMPHAWTQVYLDGNWRLMDPTLKVDAYMDPDYLEMRAY